MSNLFIFDPLSVFYYCIGIAQLIILDSFGSTEVLVMQSWITISIG
jgi:hypothetical protein